jgi:uncharacterized small protein (DUF1192 family)
MSKNNTISKYTMAAVVLCLSGLLAGADAEQSPRVAAEHAAAVVAGNAYAAKVNAEIAALEAEVAALKAQVDKLQAERDAAVASEAKVKVKLANILNLINTP